MYFKKRLKTSIYTSVNIHGEFYLRTSQFDCHKVHTLFDYLSSCIKITICWTRFYHSEIMLIFFMEWNYVFWIYVTTSEKSVFFLPRFPARYVYVILFFFGPSLFNISQCWTTIELMYNNVSLISFNKLVFFMNIYFNLCK